MPTVSVIIPNYNHARYLTKRIESVLNQTFQDFEVIILDDKSPDDSLTIIEKYKTNPKVSNIIINETNSGSTFKQWNKGVAHSKGEWIWLAESDDYCDDQFLERLLAVAAKDKNIGLAYCKSNIIDQDDNKINNPYADANVPEDLKFTQDFIAEGTQYCIDNILAPIIGNASSAIFKKSIFDKIGGADTSLILCGDWKMWHELLLHTYIGYSAVPMNYFRHHTNNVRSTKGAKYFFYELVKITYYLLKKVKMSDSQLGSVNEMLFRQVVFWMGKRGNEIPCKIKYKILKMMILHDLKFFYRIAKWPIEKLLKKTSRQNLVEL